MAELLNLAHLATLAAVVDHGGFTRAARALRLSQSTVSQHINLLEQRLGTELVVRDARGVALTEDGQQLLDDGRALLAGHDALVRRFDARRNPQIAIGATEHAADSLLPRIISTVRDAYPDRRVTFTLDRSPQLVEAVGAGRLDLALTLALAGDAPGERVGSLALRWLAAPGLGPAAPGDPVNLVAFDGSCGIRELAVARLRRSGHNADIAVQAATLDGVVTAARAGLGVALLPVSLAVPEGLSELADLPDAGRVGVNLVARRGIDARLAATAGAAVASLLD
ncbi:LysR family transcriptional regulator [Gordonia crocea]|uniref:LysR family transcriptional regulator n=1 Tax=Gordonia crocea TaxID=589162 RepID=A0A7I9UW33_9ACTN|nr:LysR family transcriptional regulator [Gordonia crocea]GED97153.1 LysR family transcriptional regulator [Gordonia crocea]